MKKRWVLGAAVGFTALTAIHDSRLVLEAARTIGRYSTTEGTQPLFAMLPGHGDVVLALVKLTFSASMLAWWLWALLIPAHRPLLRVANGAFSGWQLVQITLVWIAVLGVLLPVANSGDAPIASAIRVVGGTDLAWLVPLTLCPPALQFGLGEWACRLSAPTAQAQAAPTIASAGAG